MIKNLGGVFGRNPTFNNVEVEGDLTVEGSIIGTVVVDAGTLTGATLANNVVNSSLTSVGTLANLTVTNTISGSINGNAATATSASTATTAGTVTTAAQPTITSVGTLTGLTVSTAIAGSVTGSSDTVTNPNLTGEVTTSGLNATVANSAVIGKIITGYVSGAGTVAATDTILQAIQKLNGNAGAGIALPVSIANGGTGQTTAKNALDALLPSQTGKSGYFLQSNGVSPLWNVLASDASTLEGTTLKSTVVNSSLTSVGTLTNLSVANTIVGNVNTASQLLNTRAITLGGEASGATNFDGSSNVTITTLIPLLDGGNY